MDRKTLEKCMPAVANIQAVVGYRLVPGEGPYIIVAMFLLVKDAILFVTAAAPGQYIGEYAVLTIDDSNQEDTMSEERKPYIPMNSTAKLVTEDEQKVELSRRRIAIGLECDKIAALPAGYWPNEWREHLGRLSTCGAALLRLMTNEKEAHELEKRAFAAINEVEKAYLDLEAANFPVTDVSCQSRTPAQ